MASPSTRGRRAFVAALLSGSFSGLAFAGDVTGSGPVRTQARPLGAFTGIALSLPAQVELRTGPAESIAIETNENLLPLIETSVEDDVLRIRATRPSLGLSAPVLKMVVTTRRIESLSLAGSGQFHAGSLQASKLKLRVAGSGSIGLERVECASVAVSISGSGHIALDGVAPELAASVMGKGVLQADRLQSRTASVSIIGGGEATVWAARALNASVLGAGHLRYYGNPTLSASTVGSGSIQQAGAAPS